MAAFTAILILLAAILLSSLINQFIPRLSVPLVQLILGVAVALIFPHFDLKFEPDMLMFVFIAPLLFDEARQVDQRMLVRLRWPILGLAVGLVFVETLALGYFLNTLVAGLSLAAAFALAAALSPTDSVAVTALGERASLPPDSEQLLSGEALINDASGIIAFQFALAAALTGHFSLESAAQHFLVVFFGGLAVGAAVGIGRSIFVHWTRKIGMGDITFHIIIELLTPFIAYLVAEGLHVSGILAVVAAGLGASFRSRHQTTPETARQNLVSTSVWAVISFVLNGIVFLLLGTELPESLRNILHDTSHSIGALICYVLLATIVLYALRALWLAIMMGLRHASQRRQQNRRGRERQHQPGRARERRAAALAARKPEWNKTAPTPQQVQAVVACTPAPEVESATLPATTPPAEQTLAAAAPKPAATTTAPAPAAATEEPAAETDGGLIGGLRNLLTLTFAGARGAVALGVALTIPVMIAPGRLFPDRDLIVFIASGVIVLTLIVANFLLPILAPPTEKEPSAEELAAISDIYREVIKRLSTERTHENHFALETVVHNYQERINSLQQERRISDAEVNKLRLQALNWERERTLSLQRENKVSRQQCWLYLQQLKRSRNIIMHRSHRGWLITITNLLLRRARSAKRRREQHSALRMLPRQQRAIMAREARHNQAAKRRQEHRTDLRNMSRQQRALMAREGLTMRVDNYRFVVDRLTQMLETEKDPTKIQSINVVQAEYRRRLARFEGDQVKANRMDQAEREELQQEAAALAERGREKAREATEWAAEMKAEREAERKADRQHPTRSFEEEVTLLTTHALDYERQAINQAASDDRISRAQAKELRDNVAFMELDLHAGEDD